jgi:hypothetical protein
MQRLPEEGAAAQSGSGYPSFFHELFHVRRRVISVFFGGALVVLGDSLWDSCCCDGKTGLCGRWCNWTHQHYEFSSMTLQGIIKTSLETFSNDNLTVSEDKNHWYQGRLIPATSAQDPPPLKALTYITK